MDRVRAKLHTHMAKAIEAGKVQARVEGEKIAQLAKGFAPAEEGKLIASIRVEDADTIATGGGGESGFVGVLLKAGDASTIVTNKTGGEFQNALIQEYGTKARAAHPFFGPAKRLQKRAARAAIKRAIRRVWKG
ncbi:hypothetical protein CKO11_12365 [Rhodobacter sp. TJ_12]|uniref:hypothetical protein n=1 Tax=Rhodobacter sp. TJ_12 TaxID=2029399 RepID=UPI001CBEB52A|nr:hypothetical protein [Rhodobacter sp. TJ_12]MBZ4023252.1 hypothetical protein [Rhodobacter sp. TJ_12]